MKQNFLFSKYLLEILVFLCGAVVMMVELVGSRLLAPDFGNSIYVWTGLIGVILFSLSLGYLVGGVVADKKSGKKTLSYLLLLAGIFLLLTPSIYYLSLKMISNLGVGIIGGSLLVSLMVFLIPNLLLGAVLPVVAKIYIRDFSKLGLKVGLLYTLSTLGSIAGVFLSGYYLIPTFGTRFLLLGLGSILITFSLIVYIGGYIKVFVSLFLIVFLVMAPDIKIDNNIIAKAESNYNSLQVLDGYSGGKLHRYLKANNTIQSSICVDCAEGSLDSVYKNYQINFCYKPDIKRVLVIGGGGYSMVMDMLERYEIEDLDVVEIDPEMTRLAEKYFQLDRSDKRLNIYHEDGRVFLNDYKGDKYDLILVNAFMNSYSVPFQLTTLEAVNRIDAVLNDDGLVWVNLISDLDTKSSFLASEYSTYTQVFGQVEIFPQNPDNPSFLQNIFLVASKEELDVKAICMDNFPENYENNNDWDNMILRDDYAPVESYFLAKY